MSLADLSASHETGRRANGERTRRLVTRSMAMAHGATVTRKHSRAYPHVVGGSAADEVQEAVRRAAPARRSRGGAMYCYVLDELLVSKRWAVQLSGPVTGCGGFLCILASVPWTRRSEGGGEAARDPR